MNDTEKTINVTAVTAIKTNKKGGKFISVKDETDTWWYVGDSELFPLFQKGTQVECRVNRDNDFARIVDAYADGLGVKAAPGANKGQTESLQLAIENLRNEILDSLEEVKKLINPL